MSAPTRNAISCRECGDPIESDELSRRVNWGFWDADTQNYRDGARVEVYCESCWREDFQRDAAAYYDVRDSERFWAILKAADGQLVADLNPMTIGGRGWIAVVDGSLHGLHLSTEVSENGDCVRMETTVEESDVDREWFEEFFASVDDDDRDGPPMTALLKPREETPFDDWEVVPEDQQRLTDVEADGGETDA
jgi:hypothetical protein